MRVVAVVDRDQVVDLVQQRQADRGVELAHLRVDAQAGDLIDAGDAVIAHQSDLIRQSGVMGRHGAAFQGVEDLRRVKAEDLRVAEPADRPTAMRGAERVRGVEDQVQAASSGERLERVDGARPPPQMHADDCPGSRRHGLRDTGGIEGVGVAIDVCKHRCQTFPRQCMCGGDEGERRQDDLAAEPERADTELQRGRAAAHRNAVRHPEPCGESFLQRADLWAVVGDPTGVEDGAEAFQHALPVADVRTADVQRGVECRSGAVHGEIAARPLHAHRRLVMRSRPFAVRDTTHDARR